jgi:hypothetical protein
MGFIDILEQYAGGSPPAATADAHQHFDTVAASASRDSLGAGIAQALKSGGGSFGDSISQLFGNSNGEQRAGILGQLLRTVGPAVLPSIAGGTLSRFGQGGATTSVSPEEANAVTPSQAGELANAAQQSDPSIIDKAGAFYAQHPTVVKVLGAATLAMAMNHMAKRTQA